MNQKLTLTLVLLLLVVFSFSAIADSVIPPPANIRLTVVDQLNNEEQVFICPTDSNIIIANWRDFRLNYRRVGIGRSTDGGQTWIDSLISDANMIWGLDSKQSDPTMTVDRFGNFYMSVLDWDAFGVSGLSTIGWYRSDNKGLTWNGPFSVLNHTPIAGVFEDKQFITVDRTGGAHDGNVYISWTRFYNGLNRIVFASSLDGAENWRDTVTVGPNQTSSACGSTVYDAGQFSIPIVSTNGDVHVFWQGTVLDSASCSISSKIKHSVSTDGGLSFTYEDEILPVSAWMTANGGINTYSQPAGDADIFGGPFDGNIYIAFTNIGDEDPIGNQDVDVIKSTDNALTWSDRVRINDDDAVTDSNDSFHPWLIVNEDGVVIVIFYDQRLDVPSHYLFDLFAAYSFDGGESYTTNHRITNLSSDPGWLAKSEFVNPYDLDENGNMLPTAMAPRAGLIGEYICVTAFHDKVNAVWTDTRDHNSEVYTANWYLPLLEPRLALPSDGAITNGQPTLSWATTWKHDDDHYRLEVSTDPGFATIDFTAETDTVFWTPASPTLNGIYYWRVKSFKNSTTDSSEYSPVWSFEADNTPPAAAPLLYPPDFETTLNPQPQFGWGTVTAKSTVLYDLHLATDDSLPNKVTTIYPNIVDPFFDLPDLLIHAQPYQWQIIARDGAGNESQSSFFHLIYYDYPCADINLTGDVDVSDLTYFVAYLFRSGPPLPVEVAADLNGDGEINISDLTYFVDWLFRGGPDPICR